MATTLAGSRGSGLLAKLQGMLSFGGGGKTAVGLSVGTSSVKLAELQRVGKAWKLLHFGVVQLAEDAIVNREVVNGVAVGESVRTLTGQLQLKSKNVCGSISGTSVIIKKLSLEVPNLRDLQEQVFWEAEQYLPFDVSEVVMDYHLLSHGKDKETQVLLVAVKRSVLDGYMEAIEGSGLKPKIMDVDYFALQNLLEANYQINPGEAVAIVDLGASSTKLVVVQEGVPVFTKDSALGGRNLTAEIERHLNLPYADAESLKVSAQPGEMPQEVLELMQVMNENFASEIKRGLDFYGASSTGAPVAYVLLAGGAARQPDLSRVVEEALGGTPVQIINPFNSISYDPGVFTQEYIQAISSVAAVPLGLALRAGA